MAILLLLEMTTAFSNTLLLLNLSCLFVLTMLANLVDKTLTNNKCTSVLGYFVSTFALAVPQVIAGLYCNTTMVLGLLENTRFPDNTDSITTQFFREWVKGINLFAG